MNTSRIEQGMSQKSKDIFSYSAAGFLIVTAVALAFISFLMTLAVGTGVITWGALSMATALTFIGGGMYFHNQLVTFETKANQRMEEINAQVDMEIRRMNQHPIRATEEKETKTDNYFDPEEA